MSTDTDSPMLVVLTGLPGTGKSMLADGLGAALPAAVVSVDPIEAALWRAGVARTEPTGLAAYAVAQTVVAGQLRLGLHVIADAVNSAAPARQAWTELADEHRAVMRVIEVVCSDRDLHRARLATRSTDVPGFPRRTWEAVEVRRLRYQPWFPDRLVVDSAEDFQANLRLALDHLTRQRGVP